MKLFSLFAVATLLASSTGLPAAASRADMVKQFKLKAQNDSGQYGTVTLLGKDDGTTIVHVRVANPGADPEPAHIHAGGCAKLNPKPTYPLTALVNGQSTTTVSQPIAALLGHGFAVNVHKSAKEASVYVSCGDLT